MLDWPWNGFECFLDREILSRHTSHSPFFINANGSFSLEISSNIGRGNITKCIWSEIGKYGVRRACSRFLVCKLLGSIELAYTVYPPFIFFSRVNDWGLGLYDCIVYLSFIYFFTSDRLRFNHFILISTILFCPLMRTRTKLLQGANSWKPQTIRALALKAHVWVV